MPLSAPASAAPQSASGPELPAAGELLENLLRVSLTGVILFRPVYAGGEIVDLAYERLNPAAQRMLRLPERPAQTFLALYPHAAETGVFAFYRDAFLAGQPARHDVNYQHDGLDNFFHLAAQRCGPLLAVSFTDTADHDRSAVEQALRESQAREQAALATAEAQRQQLHAMFVQAPAMICVFGGPAHVFELVNPPYQRLVGERPLLGLPIRQAMPELAGQPIFDLLDEVYRTGTPFLANEMLVQLDHDNSAPAELEKRYYNFTYQPRRDARGQIDGILVFAYEVTPLVRSRQQVQHLNGELAATNEELQVANEEFLAGNAELLRTQQALEELNQELETINQDLEARVHERTVQLQAAKHEAERQREQFFQVFEQTPALVCLLRGPEHRFAYANPSYQRLHAGRRLLGRPVAEAAPEAETQGFLAALACVYETGETRRGQEVPYELAGGDGDGDPRVRYFDYTYQAFREDGTVVGVAVFAFDVTEQVLARRAADRQRQLLHTLFMDAPAPIVILGGPAHVFELVNPAYQRIFPGRALLGKPLCAALPELAGGPIPDILNGVYQTGETYEAREMPLRLARCEGGPLEEIFWTFTYQARRDARGQVDGVLVFAYDVTDQVRARQQVQQLNHDLQATNDAQQAANAALSRANGQLTRTNQDLDNFVYAASHDLKQPVNNLVSLFEELRHAVRFRDPADEQTLLPLVGDALRQLSTSIDDLAALGEAQHALHTGAAETVNLAELTQEVLQTLQPQALAAGAQVSTDFAACPALHFSRANLRTVLLNLVGNSLKYADPHRPARVRVAVRAPADAGHVVLEVEDNGLGFDTARHGAELFQLFRRFHPAHAAGTGVGLYLVNRIVQANGGHVEVESQVGRGTTFRLHLRE